MRFVAVFPRQQYSPLHFFTLLKANVMTERFSHAPIGKLLGFHVEPDNGGPTIVRLPVGPNVHNSMGRVHGGAIAVIADASMGIAFGRTLDPGQEFSTVHLNVEFMRPIRAGELVASAVVVQRGLRMGFVRCEIHDQRNKLIATATCTCTLLNT
jgi:uncharacterized protein (TIGR00369 family)